MTTFKKAAVVCLVALVSSTPACYRTHYTNFAPATPIEAVSDEPQITAEDPSGWQAFFLWGWVPGERRYRPDQTCGGADRIEAIRTQQTFLQGLVEALSSYYVNIYSPYDLRIDCKD